MARSISTVKEGTASPSPAPRRWAALAALGLGVFLVQVDTLAVNLALPRMGRELHAGVSALQWIVTAYTMSYACLLLLGGTLGDARGRRRAYLAGLGAFLVGSAVCAAARTLYPVIAGRVIQGIGAALAMPGTLALVRQTFPGPEERAWAIGIWATVMGSALALGPTLGGVIVARAGWRYVFLLNLPLGAAAAILTLRCVEESARQPRASPDLPGQLLAVAALACLAFAVIQGRLIGWRPALAVGAAAAAALAAFLAVERHSAHPMVPLELFHSRSFAGAAAETAMMTFGMYGLLFVASVALQSFRGQSPIQAGLTILPMSLTFVAVSPLVSRLTRRFGHRRIMACGMACMGAGELLLAALPGSGLPVIVVSFLVVGAGMGLNTGPVLDVIVGSVPENRAGLAAGLANVARMVGATLGVAVLGAILAAHSPSAGGGPGTFLQGMRWALAVGGLVEAAGAAVVLAFVKR